MSYDFTAHWFEQFCKGAWEKILPPLAPTKVLEIGCYEGMATCWLIENLPQLEELHCVDNWDRSRERANDDMDGVRRRFFGNTDAAMTLTHPINFFVHDKPSANALELLMQQRKDYFDFIYLDGSHERADVLNDAHNAWALVRPGGIIALDDTREAGPRGAFEMLVSEYGAQVINGVFPPEQDNPPPQRYVRKP